MLSTCVSTHMFLSRCAPSRLQNQATDLQETLYGVYIITEHSIRPLSDFLQLVISWWTHTRVRRQRRDSANPYSYV
jgi:hypothetical protein